MHAIVGVLHYMKPSGGVSPACRTLVSCKSPRLVTMRSRFEVLWCPKCRPPHRNRLKTGGYMRGGLRFGHNGACRAVLFAREPLNMRVNPLIRTSTPQHAPGRPCPRAHHRVNVRNERPMRMSSGRAGRTLSRGGSDGIVPGEFCRTTTQVRPLLGGRHLRSNREPTCWDHHKRIGMKKALPKECFVEMQNPHRWIAPRGAAARPKGLEPPTF